MKKIIKYLVFFSIIFLTMVMSSWLVWYTISGGKKISKKISAPFLQLAQMPNNILDFWANGIFSKESRLIQDTSQSDGFQILGNLGKTINGKILTSTFNENHELEIKLINISNSTIIKKWVIKDDTILKLDFKAELDKYKLRLTHPLLTKDSSIIFNTDNLLICIDKNNTLKWVNHEIFHHSIEQLNDTELWACSRIESLNAYTLNGIDTLVNDAIAKVDINTGKTIFKKSIADILVENGYLYLMAIGGFESDAIHLNEVYPSNINSNYWEYGDLLISLRHRSTIFLYRPSTNKIIWLKTGPWSNQHSCSFIDSTKIMVFGNDVIRSQNTTLLDKYNHVYIFDFKNNTISTPFNNVMAQLQIKTLSEGRVTYLKEGRIFIDESNNGKVYFIDSLTPILKYTERADSTHIKMFNWNRYIPN